MASGWILPILAAASEQLKTHAKVASPVREIANTCKKVTHEVRYERFGHACTYTRATHNEMLHPRPYIAKQATLTLTRCGR